MTMTRVLPNLAATIALATRVATLVRPGDAILLNGPLGAGKSELARAIIRHLTGQPALEVPSPSFTLAQTYDTPRGMVVHFDLWRLSGAEALGELGWDEARAGIVLVEWAERLGSLRPDDGLAIALAPGWLTPDEAATETGRVARLSGWPDRLERLAS